MDPLIQTATRGAGISVASQQRVIHQRPMDREQFTMGERRSGFIPQRQSRLCSKPAGPATASKEYLDVTFISLPEIRISNSRSDHVVHTSTNTRHPSQGFTIRPASCHPTISNPFHPLQSSQRHAKTLPRRSRSHRPLCSGTALFTSLRISMPFLPIIFWVQMPDFVAPQLGWLRSSDE